MMCVNSTGSDAQGEHSCLSTLFACRIFSHMKGDSVVSVFCCKIMYLIRYLISKGPDDLTGLCPRLEALSIPKVCFKIYLN